MKNLVVKTYEKAGVLPYVFLTSVPSVSYHFRLSYLLIRRLGGPQGWSGRFEEEKNIYLLRKAKLDSLVVQPVIIDTVVTQLPRLTLLAK
jgi:hypothetical protein